MISRYIGKFVILIIVESFYKLKLEELMSVFCWMKKNQIARIILNTNFF